jgi:hypothetical protein
MLLAFTFLTLIGLIGLTIIAARKRFSVSAALLSAAAWIFAAVNYFIWRWS